ncbi:glycosyltransferase [archaeon]|nr:glycosyltransferase [archaeon]
MKVSVIVPTYNNEATVRSCLDSLKGQEVKGEYEVLVVDDGSTDGTAGVVGDYDVKLLKQEHKGPAAARNLGAKNAGGDILLFTDADCTPERDWIEKMCAPFTDEAVVGVQGVYKTRQKSPTARFVQYEIEERYGIMSKAQRIDFIGSYSAAYRKGVFLAESGFDEKFPIASGEDTDLSYRLASKGHKMVFAQDAIVYHEHPSRITQYLKMKFYRAYWRVDLYRKTPVKTVKDTYTPQMLKLQIALFYLFVVSLFSSLVAFIFLLTTLPLALQILKKDRFVGTLAPAFVAFRTIAFGTGLIYGLAASVLRKN